MRNSRIAMLMLDDYQKIVIPIGEGIFYISQFNSEKKLKKKYLGNIIIRPDGKLDKIKDIKITGTYRDTFLAKVFCFMNSTKSISVDLENIEVTMEDIKSKLLEYLKNDMNREEPYLEQRKKIESIEKEIIGAKNIQAFFEILDVPNQEDCLDVMV